MVATILAIREILLIVSKSITLQTKDKHPESKLGV